MKTHYLCCEGDFDNLIVKHYAENSQAAIDYLETHGGGIFYNTEKQLKMWIWGCKSPMDKGTFGFDKNSTLLSHQ